jgi:hypothetical protein
MGTRRSSSFLEVPMTPKVNFSIIISLYGRSTRFFFDCFFFDHYLNFPFVTGMKFLHWLYLLTNHEQERA